MDPRARILHESESLFKLRGVRSVTMDDISKALGMSKKTLYQFFANKAEIVHAVTEAHFSRESKTHEAVIALAQDPIDAILRVMEVSAKGLAEIPYHMVSDIRKHYPKSWLLFDEFKRAYVLDVLRENLRIGIQEGLYRRDMDIELVALLRVVQIEAGMNETYFPESKFPFALVQIEHFKLYLHGIVTLKGKRLLYKYLNQPEDE